MHRARLGGFTIIEVMLVMVILGVLMAVAAPSIRSMIATNRIATESGDLVQDLQYARSEASAKGQRVSICIRNAAGTACNAEGAWTDGWMVFIDSPNAGAFGTVNGTDRILKVHEALTSGNTFVLAPNAAFINFRPSGPTATGATQTITVCKPTFTGKVVTILITGRISSANTAAVCP